MEPKAERLEKKIDEESNINETLHSQEEEDLEKPPKAPTVEILASKRKRKNPPCLSTLPTRKSVRIFEGRVPETFVCSSSTLDFSECEKESSPEEKLQQNEASEKECKFQNLQLEVDCSVDYVLIDSDKEYGELEVSEEFEENPDMQDIGENTAEFPSEDYPEFRLKIVKEVIEKLDQEGLDTLATESSREENVVTIIVMRKGEFSTLQSVNRTPDLASEWIDLFNQEPLPPPNLSTPLSAGINLFQ